MQCYRTQTAIVLLASLYWGSVASQGTSLPSLLSVFMGSSPKYHKVTPKPHHPNRQIPPQLRRNIDNVDDAFGAIPAVPAPTGNQIITAAPLGYTPGAIVNSPVPNNYNNGPLVNQPIANNYVGGPNLGNVINAPSSFSSSPNVSLILPNRPNQPTWPPPHRGEFLAQHNV